MTLIIVDEEIPLDTMIIQQKKMAAKMMATYESEHQIKRFNVKMTTKTFTTKKELSDSAYDESKTFFSKIFNKNRFS